MPAWIVSRANALAVGVTPWSVLAAGVLTGKYGAGDAPAEGCAKEGAATVERNLKIAAEVVAVAEEVGCSPSQVAISWVRRQPGVVIPLIGACNLAQLRDNLGALDVELSGGQRARLDEASRVELGFPHDFLAEEPIRRLVYGGVEDRLDNHHAT